MAIVIRSASAEIEHDAQVYDMYVVVYHCEAGSLVLDSSTKLLPVCHH